MDKNDIFFQTIAVLYLKYSICFKLSHFYKEFVNWTILSKEKNAH